MNMHYENQKTKRNKKKPETKQNKKHIHVL